MTSKPLVYIHNKEEDEPLCGVNEAAQKIMNEYFQLVTAFDLKIKPDIVSRIRGAIYSVKFASALHELLPEMTSLQAISTISTGTDWVPVKQLKEMGFAVGYCPAYQQQNKTIADFAILLMLSVSRKFTEELSYYDSKGKDWCFFINQQGNDVTNKTLGIVGMGRIGTQLAKRAKAFDMNVVYHNRNKSTLSGAEDFEYIDELDRMLPMCHFVAICCPLNDSTKYMFKKKQFELMKNTAILINISRGKVVDTDDLVEALKTGQLGGAGLDATDPEPLPEGHELFHLPNVIITPHCSSHSQEAKAEVWSMVRDNLKAVIIDGKPPPYEVISE